MRVEVTLWIVANLTSFIIGGKELWVTSEVWFWARKNLRDDSIMYRISLRNFRTSLLKFLLASAFVIAGVSLLVPSTGTFRIWLLVLGAILLSLDIVMESRYRGSMFEAARRRAEEARVSTASDDDE